MEKLLKALDILGSQIQLNYKKNLSLKTIFGGVMTLFFCAAALGFAYFFGKDIVLKEQPTITLTSKYHDQSELYFSDLPIFFNIMDSSGNERLDFEKYMTLEGVKYVYHQNETNPFIMDLYHNYTFSHCSKSHFGEKFYDLALKSGLNDKSICLNTNENEKIYNDLAKMNSSFFYIAVSLCDNSTRNLDNLCAPEEDIKYLFRELWIVVQFPTYNIKPEDYNKPIEVLFHNHPFQVSLDMYKMTWYNFIKTQVSTDNGIITEEIETKSINKFKSFYYDMTLSYRFNPNRKAMMTFTSEQIGDLYLRRYIKLQSILGNIGGLLNIGMVLMSLICSKISETSFYIQLSKDFVSFYERDDKEDVNSIDTQSFNVFPFTLNPEDRQNISTNTVHSLPSSFLHITDFIKLSNRLGQSSSSKEIFDNSLKVKKKMGLCSYFKNFFCKNRKNKVSTTDIDYESLIFYMKSKLDIYSLIRLYNEFSILKKVFFDNSSGKDICEIFKADIKYSDVLQDVKLQNIERKADEAYEKKMQEDNFDFDLENYKKKQTSHHIERKIQMLNRNIQERDLFIINNIDS